jgi:carboxyl-terminal processing protease
MGNKTKIAIGTGAAILLAAGLVILLHQPPKPVRVRQSPRVTEIVGVGIQLSMDTQTRAVIIQQAVPNTPAAEAGIASGLIVSKVDGVSLEGKSLVQCVDLIRGPVGTTVQLELVAPDGSRTNAVELTRRKLKLKNGNVSPGSGGP